MSSSFTKFAKLLVGPESDLEACGVVCFCFLAPLLGPLFSPTIYPFLFVMVNTPLINFGTFIFYERMIFNPFTVCTLYFMHVRSGMEVVVVWLLLLLLSVRLMSSQTWSTRESKTVAPMLVPANWREGGRQVPIC